MSAARPRRRTREQDAEKRSDEDVAGKVDAGVDARVADRRREDPQRDGEARPGAAGRRGEREARRRVPDGKEREIGMRT